MCQGGFSLVLCFLAWGGGGGGVRAMPIYVVFGGFG